MMKCIFFLSFSFLLSPAIATERSALIAPSATRPEQHPAHRRRFLSPEADIIDELNSQLAEGIRHPRFTLTAVSSHGALFADNGNNNNNNKNNSPLFEIDVVLINPSVTDSTSFSSDGSFDHPSPVHNLKTTKLLVADRAESSSSRVFAVLAVNETSGVVSGIVQKDGRLYRLEQNDGPTVVVEVNYDPPNNNNWTCLVNSTHGHDETAGGHMHGIAEEKRVRKHRQHEHESDDTSTSIFDNNHRREAKRKLYATDTFPNAWTYQVDLYIQVDNDFVANHDTDTVNMPNTIDYVNALVSAGEIYMKLALNIFDCCCRN